jgi:hypothetical protein
LVPVLFTFYIQGVLNLNVKVWCQKVNVQIVLKSGSLNILEPLGPVQACKGIAVLYSLDYKKHDVHPSTAGRSGKVSDVEEGNFVLRKVRKNRFASNIKGPKSINHNLTVSSANISRVINISTNLEQSSLRLPLIVQINAGYISVTSELKVMCWFTYERRARDISHASYPGYCTYIEIFTHAERSRRHDAKGKKASSFQLRNANKSSDNAASGLGQVSAGFPSVKELGYAYDIIVLSAFRTF